MTLNPTNLLLPGQEQYEWYWSRTLGTELLQYDYRHPRTGELFACIADSLDAARAKRNAWLEKQNARRSE